MWKADEKNFLYGGASQKFGTCIHNVHTWRPFFSQLYIPQCLRLQHALISALLPLMQQQQEDNKKRKTAAAAADIDDQSHKKQKQGKYN